VDSVNKKFIDFDKRCLADLGLKMPRCTPKYLKAIAAHSHHYGVSSYFGHIQAARRGTQWLYRDLQKMGYTWENNRWTPNQKARDHSTLVKALG